MCGEFNVKREMAHSVIFYAVFITLSMVEIENHVRLCMGDGSPPHCKLKR